MQPTAPLPGSAAMPAEANVYCESKHLFSLYTFFAVILFTLAIRGAFLWQFRAGLHQDPDAYREIAENILQQGVFGFTQKGDAPPSPRVVPTAYRPPLYPLLLASLRTPGTRHVSLTQVAVVHLALGVATVGLTWFCAWRFCEMPQWQATLASLIVACDPILLHQQSLVMTETLAALLAVLALTGLAGWSCRPSVGSSVLVGLTLGLSSLCRPTFLPWLGMVVGAMVVAPRAAITSGMRIRHSAEALSRMGRATADRRRLLWAGIVAGVGLAVMLPWGLRNAGVFGRLILTTTHGGYTLELGNNPQFYDWLSSQETLPWDSRAWQAERQAAMSELQVNEPSELFWDQWAYQRAWQTIRQRPGDFAWASLYRVGQLWSPLPHRLADDPSAVRSVGRWLVAGWYCSVYLLAAYGLAHLGRKLFGPPWLWGLLLVASWTCVHTLYWTNLRMRAPLIPFLALLAGQGADMGAAVLRAWRRALYVRHVRPAQDSGEPSA